MDRSCKTTTWQWRLLFLVFCFPRHYFPNHSVLASRSTPAISVLTRILQQLERRSTTQMILSQRGSFGIMSLERKLGRGHSGHTKRFRSLGLEDSSRNSVLPEINQSINKAISHQSKTSLSTIWGHSRKVARLEGSKQREGSGQNPIMPASGPWTSSL